MSHIPAFNIPAFDAAAAALRASGYAIVSPAELDDPETRALCLASPDGAPSFDPSQTWGAYLSRDVRLVADECEGIVFLPGWDKSRGARLEAMVGVLCGHTFAIYTGAQTNPPLCYLGTHVIRNILAESLKT
jgi:hypothetical protein